MRKADWKLYERVRLPDGRQGLILCIFWPGSRPGQHVEPEETYTVLTDDYTEVLCFKAHLTRVKRTGELVKVNDPAGMRRGMFYQVEEDNLERRRKAVRKRAPMPAEEDIRAAEVVEWNQTLQLF